VSYGGIVGAIIDELSGVLTYSDPSTAYGYGKMEIKYRRERANGRN
jgi:hypothetical protein